MLYPVSLFQILSDFAQRHINIWRRYEAGHYATRVLQSEFCRLRRVRLDVDPETICAVGRSSIVPCCDDVYGSGNLLSQPIMAEGAVVVNGHRFGDVGRDMILVSRIHSLLAGNERNDEISAGEKSVQPPFLSEPGGDLAGSVRRDLERRLDVGEEPGRRVPRRIERFAEAPLEIIDQASKRCQLGFFKMAGGIGHGSRLC